MPIDAPVLALADISKLKAKLANLRLKRYGDKARAESPRTTKLDDRTADVITLDEVERIVI